MKSLFKFILPVIVVSLFQISCVKGCIDDNAINYDPEATVNKGCIYPEIFNLTSVGVKFHPSTDIQGDEWDLNSGPDKFIKIFNDETNSLLYTTTVEEYTPVTWTVDPYLSLEAESVILRFELYDQDETEDVLMDVGTLDLKSLTGSTAETTNNLYPGSGTISGTNGTSFTVAMTWTE